MINNWREVVLFPEATIEDALKILNLPSNRLVLVVSEKDVLLGVITDGDIRRALLRGKHLKSSVSEAMNSTPITINNNSYNHDVEVLISKTGVSSFPVLKEDKIIGLVVSEKTGAFKFKRDNPVFIMAGGFGTRLGELTKTCPKPMLKIGGKPLLEIIIEGLIKNGLSNFYISTHYMPDVIENFFEDGSKWGVKIKYIYEKEPLGTGGSLGLLPSDVNPLPILLVNGDILTNMNYANLIDFHEKQQSAATVCVRTHEITIPYGVIENDGIKITSMMEKPTHSFFVNAGIYVLDHKIKKLCNPNEYIDLPSLIERNMAINDNTFLFPIHEYWLDIGSPNDFSKAQIDIDNLKF